MEAFATGSQRREHLGWGGEEGGKQREEGKISSLRSSLN